MLTFFKTYFEPMAPGALAPKCFDCVLFWKNSVLPNVDWPEEYLKPGNEKCLASLCMVNLGAMRRIMFGGGLSIPVSPNEPSSYEFLKRFSADAPFKMSAKHFSVIIPIGKKSKLASRKPDAEVFKKLSKVIG